MKAYNRTCSYFITIIIFIFYSSYAQGQKQSFLAIDYGYGNQDWLNLEYFYRGNLYGLNYSKYFVASGPLDWSILLNPHFVKSRFICNVCSDEVEYAYEAGLGLGVLGSFHMVAEQFFLWFSVQSGPHYISDAPDRQVPGFIFSNQFKVGMEYNLYKKWSLSLYLGFRHLSNGETRLPNGGINNLLRGLQVKLVL